MKATTPPLEQLDPESKTDRKYFLSYQEDAILEEARLNLIEKSIRVGITYAHAARAVRRRMLGKGNLLHTSVNERSAKEFATDCKRFCKIYDVVGASDVRELETFNAQENRSETAFEIFFKKQDVKIAVFSSNPDAIRSQGGEVNIDEITSHKRPDDMIQAAGGRAMWGYPLNIWSSHKGMHSALNRLIKEERAKGAASRWKIKTVTLPQALDAGLLEKINEVSGAAMTREEFIADTKAMVGGEDAYAEECLCIPRMSGAQAIKWGFLDAAKGPIPLLRKHLDGDESFSVDSWIAPLVPILKGASRVALGYDVARTGHLSALPIIAEFGGKWTLMSLLTMHKRRFPLQFEAAAGLMRGASNMVGAGDAGGLGMQICEQLRDLFGEARFACVNFSQSKPDMGTRLIRTFEDGAFRLSEAREDEDIIFDLAALQIFVPAAGGPSRFVETANPINKLSHCDIAWAIGLALLAAGTQESCGVY